MPKILVIRDTTITAEIDQREGEITTYAITGENPITLLHEAHATALITNVSEALGREITFEDFIVAAGLTDERPKTSQDIL